MTTTKLQNNIVHLKTLIDDPGSFLSEAERIRDRFPDADVDAIVQRMGFTDFNLTNASALRANTGAAILPQINLSLFDDFDESVHVPNYQIGDDGVTVLRGIATLLASASGSEMPTLAKRLDPTLIAPPALDVNPITSSSAFHTFVSAKIS